MCPYSLIGCRPAVKIALQAHFDSNDRMMIGGVSGPCFSSDRLAAVSEKFESSCYLHEMGLVAELQLVVHLRMREKASIVGSNFLY